MKSFYNVVVLHYLCKRSGRRKNAAPSFYPSLLKEGDDGGGWVVLLVGQVEPGDEKDRVSGVVFALLKREGRSRSCCFHPLFSSISPPSNLLKIV